MNERNYGNKKQIRAVVLCAIFTALICVCGPLTLPIGVIPLSLTTFFVYLSGLVLGVRGCVAVLCYLMIGAVGLPVFSGFSGGIWQIFGPTGGFLMGYPLAALVIGGIRKPGHFVRTFFAVLLGAVICYAAGVIWYCTFTGHGLRYAAPLTVYPFIVPELIKIISAVFFSSVLEKRIRLNRDK